MKEALTYDDIQIVPKYSEVESRSDCELTSRVSKNFWLKVPIVSAPMDTVTEWQMARKLWELGGLGFIHRFMTIEEQVEHVQAVRNYTPENNVGINTISTVGVHTGVITPNVLIGAAVGATGDYLKRATALISAGVEIILIDVAHGHHLHVKHALRKLSELRDNLQVDGKRLNIIAGNIATAQAAKDLIKWGADGLRVGIGNGSLCETRIRTGIGIPQVTALMEVVKVAGKHAIPVIADGAIRTPGDAAKALALGADTVMCGSLLAGTKESPGQTIQEGNFPNERLFKSYRGSASSVSKQARGENGNIEGNAKMIPYKGKAKRITGALIDGIRSSMSYVNSHNIKEFQRKAEFVKITTNGVKEAQPHLMYK